MKKFDKLKLQVKDHLDQNEEMVATVFGTYKSTTLGEKTLRNGIFVATNKRVVFYGKRTFGYDLETLPYKKISSIDAGKKLTGHTITFYTSGNKASMSMINTGDIQEFLSYTRNAIEA
ncbi:PH domain-containing protein [Bacillus sporothermodurans]|uniref:PH domain-containing protein n=1 Tax=Heyndrickxia sporothermodurans TaxID=46224 RepID=UPI00192AC8B8|nr:PH domain-containing protein [Heyndrickxia sporothermodurans]MBL5776958.1 PH domain-containing protein [Heyndrickxia sporothermodurans]MBL5798485.1 PH domain-containing protein [Heyndrickxia sporothermodurans]MBL5809402.1 PH domain-containing protein [Heyndrickxia sporothermodurans]MBL5813037.1 PH domain-containing protein [Heyndrickxia sporothermodurans]MBL5816461.1 PH domain-containing protein [Heyndrickxia sporothermodurans]